MKSKVLERNSLNRFMYPDGTQNHHSTIGANDLCTTMVHDSKNLRNVQENEDRILFNFSRYHDKLKCRKGTVFTTIRSISYAKKQNLEVGMEGWIYVYEDRLFKARLIDWKDYKIEEIPIEILKKDIAPDKVENHEEFVLRLNQFYAEIGIPYASNKLTTQKRVFFLEAL